MRDDGLPDISAPPWTEIGCELRYCEGAYFDGVRHEPGTEPYWRAHRPHVWHDRDTDGVDCWCGGT